MVKYKVEWSIEARLDLIDILEFYLTINKIEIDICREKCIKPRIKKQILKETVYAD